jgi:hypothetical protein
MGGAGNSEGNTRCELGFSRPRNRMTPRGFTKRMRCLGERCVGAGRWSRRATLVARRASSLLVRKVSLLTLSLRA